MSGPSCERITARDDETGRAVAFCGAPALADVEIQPAMLGGPARTYCSAHTSERLAFWLTLQAMTGADVTVTLSAPTALQEPPEDDTDEADPLQADPWSITR